MSDIYRHEMRRDNDRIVDRHGRWGVDLSTVWTWMGDVLAAVPDSKVDADVVQALCAQALDAHAPAVLIDAEWVGVRLERLLLARVAQVYAGRYGRPAGVYDVTGLRAVVR